MRSFFIPFWIRNKTILGHELVQVNNKNRMPTETYPIPQGSGKGSSRRGRRRSTGTDRKTAPSLLAVVSSTPYRLTATPLSGDMRLRSFNNHGRFSMNQDIREGLLQCVACI